MNAADFDTQFNRLTENFHLAPDIPRDTMSMEWFRAVEHYHIDALEHAVTVLIRTSQDRFWPPLGKLLTLVQARIDRHEKTQTKCGTCGGSTWIESWPMKTPDNRVYEYLQRCPDCGVPAPEVKPRPFMVPLTNEEYLRFKSGQWEHPSMPEGMRAKPRPESETTEIKQAMDRLRVKLFGRVEEDGAA